jgi:LytS/YehU family sensor histidine kinase
VPLPPPDLRTLLYQLGVGSVLWYAAAVALPFMLWGARRIDAERLGRLRALMIVVGIVAALSSVTAAVEYGILYRDAPMRPGLTAYLFVAIRQNVLPWIALVGLVAAIEARRRALRAAVERERLRAQVAEQRLIALTGQLHPHFLFNTLQGISTLMHRDAEAADEMLAKLSDLLRDVLRHRDHALVSFDDEIRYARTYLDIARLRFADRLDFSIEVSPDVDSPSVPLFILQPLVENALAHGIGRSARGGRVTVRAWRERDRLLLEVADTGAGLPNGLALSEGLGLTNTRERLRASFGDDQRLSIASASGGGVVARIDIPYRHHTEPRAAR